MTSTDRKLHHQAFLPPASTSYPAAILNQAGKFGPRLLREKARRNAMTSFPFTVGAWHPIFRVKITVLKISRKSFRRYSSFSGFNAPPEVSVRRWKFPRQHLLSLSIQIEVVWMERALSIDHCFLFGKICPVWHVRVSISKPLRGRRAVRSSGATLFYPFTPKLKKYILPTSYRGMHK